MSDYWQRQGLEQPLFDELLWSRPENRAQAGKLLVVGGNLHGISVPAEAYTESIKAGAGSVRVLLPESTRKMVGTLLENIDYAPSTPSGSFSRQALAEILDHSIWADAVLLAGDLGRNSETAIVMESALGKLHKPVTVTRDALDYFTTNPSALMEAANVTLVLSFAQLQKLTTNLSFPKAVTFSMDFLQLVEALHAFTLQYPINIVVKHLDTFFVAVKGQVSTTKLVDDLPVWRVKVAAHACVWLLQNPTKPFEALTTAIFTIVNKSSQERILGS